MTNNLNESIDMGLRNFIKTLGCMAGGTALLATTPWLTSCTPEKLEEAARERRARIGVIGTGSRGQYHIHNLLKIQIAEIVALCDIYQPNLDAAAKLVPGARLYKDHRKLLEDKDIDGVIIATPLGTHAALTIDSLEAGKHTFCEKAMALTMDQCKAVYDKYRDSDRVLFYCMQRMYDEKYVKAFQMIRTGLIGDIVGMRCHWFRNADWRREVPSPELERLINWRLYRENSAGLMTELGSHQLEVCTLVADKMPTRVAGFGDIVYWKDGREVYDTVSLTYQFGDGRNIVYESLISNKFNGMEEQILGKAGTVDLSKGVYYLEEDDLVFGVRQLLTQVRDGVFAAVPTAGPSWRPELRDKYVQHAILKQASGAATGQNMIGEQNDGSDIILEAFCQSCITGERAKNVVEECYSATILCLMGNQAMDEKRVVSLPEEYIIPYMKF